MSAAVRFRRAAVVLIAVTTAALGMPPIANGFGLEPTINGALTVSYPGSLDVAVAVAKARNFGALPSTDSNAASNDVLLRQMIADLRRLQSRLDAGRVAVAKGSAEPFSLVLVGPGLWSHFHMTSGGVLARYHVDGPLEGKVVVLTHQLVLEALLRGSLTAEDALDRGLLAFSGNGADSVRRAFIAGLEPRS